MAETNDKAKERAKSFSNNEKNLGTKYTDRILKDSLLSKPQIDRLYRAVLQAAQYDAFQSDGKVFRLLEGTVRVNEKGEYIFTPNKHLQALLDKLEETGCPQLLEIEESRFTDLIKIALAELKE